MVSKEEEAVRVSGVARSSLAVRHSAPPVDGPLFPDPYGVRAAERSLEPSDLGARAPRSGPSPPRTLDRNALAHVPARGLALAGPQELVGDAARHARVIAGLDAHDEGALVAPELGHALGRDVVLAPRAQREALVGRAPELERVAAVHAVGVEVREEVAGGLRVPQGRREAWRALRVVVPGEALDGQGAQPGVELVRDLRMRSEAVR